MSRSVPRNASILALAGVVLSCNALSPLEDRLELTTDRAAYVAQPLGPPGRFRDYTFTVVATFHNRSSMPVFLARCYPDTPYPIFGIGMPDGRQSAFNGAWACVGHDAQIRVAPGDSRTDTLRLRGPTSRAGMTGDPLGEFAGEMYLGYEVQTCPGDGACRRPDAGRSKPFRVTQGS